MHKLILAGTAMIWFAAPFTASATPAQNIPGAQPMEMSVVAITPAPRLQQVRDEVQLLQTQVQALLTRQQNDDSYNLAELENLPLGG